MQVSVEAGEGLLRKVHVTVAESQLQREVDKKLGELKNSARLPGFRPGKVPHNVVVKRFGKQVRDEVVGELLQASFRDAIDEQALRPAGSPRIDPLAAEPGQGLTYTAEFDVYPEIDLGDLGSLEVVRPTASVAASDIEQMIEKLQRQRREFKPVERAASIGSGDRVRIDFDGTLDGEPVDGANGKDFPVELGTGGMVPGFEEALEGLSTDDTKTFTVTFPDPYAAPHLAGKDVEFTVKVIAVEAGELPALDEAFAEAFGVRQGGVDKLREEVRSNMERELDAALRQKTQERVLDALYEARPVEVPPSLQEQEANDMQQQARQQMNLPGGVDMPPLDEEQQTELDTRARKRVAVGLLVAEVIRTGEISPDGAEVRRHIDMMASTYEEPEQVVRYFYSDPERLRGVESTVLQQQAVDWILDKVKVSEEATTFEALTGRAPG